MKYIFIAIIAASAIHILEEYLFGWVAWARRFVPGITLKQFIIVNMLFLLLVSICIIIQTELFPIAMSAASLIFINAFFHIGPAIRFREYTPGLVSAIFLYIPLAVYAYYISLSSGILTYREAIFSIILGAIWMSIPVIFQLIRTQLVKKF